MSYRNYDVTEVEVVDGVTVARAATSDQRFVEVDIDPSGWPPILTTPKGNAPMRVRWMRFVLGIPGGELSFGIEFGGELTDKRDIERRDGRSGMRRVVKAADLEERAAWSLKIVERFRPTFVAAP